MQFQWNEAKRQEILNERGVDILYAALIFEDVTFTQLDDREDYGEARFVSLGLVDDVVYTVVHTRRGDSIRLITAWKGGRRDYEEYKNRLP